MEQTLSPTTTFPTSLHSGSGLLSPSTYLLFFLEGGGRRRRKGGGGQDACLPHHTYHPLWRTLLTSCPYMQENSSVFDLPIHPINYSYSSLPFPLPDVHCCYYFLFCIDDIWRRMEGGTGHLPCTCIQTIVPCLCLAFLLPLPPCAAHGGGGWFDPIYFFPLPCDDIPLYLHTTITLPHLNFHLSFLYTLALLSTGRAHARF